MADTPTREALQRVDLHALWLECGGKFHGPHTETANIEYSKLADVLSKLFGSISLPATEGEAGELAKRLRIMADNYDATTSGHSRAKQFSAAETTRKMAHDLRAAADRLALSSEPCGGGGAGSGHHPDRKLGFRDGVRSAITWLHREAKTMDDSHATLVLNCAAFHMGVDLKFERDAKFSDIASPSPPPQPASRGGAPCASEDELREILIQECEARGNSIVGADIRDGTCKLLWPEIALAAMRRLTKPEASST